MILKSDLNFIQKQNSLQLKTINFKVNGRQLHGLSHADVVPLLKDLSMEVQMVCARPKHNEYANRDILVNFDAISNDNNSSTVRTGVDIYSAYGSLNSIVPSIDRLVKAKSDGSLAISSPTVSSATNDLSKIKSRSLEPLTGLAMWSSEPQIIELIKGDRGLGFSILDYQVIGIDYSIKQNLIGLRANHKFVLNLFCNT
jgi:hypothetical protein